MNEAKNEALDNLTETAGRWLIAKVKSDVWANAEIQNSI